MTPADSTTHVSVSLPPENLDLVRSVVLVAVALQYAYLFAFNHAPESVRIAFAGTLLAIHVALAALSLGQRPQTWQAAILLSIAMMVASWLVTYGINSDSTQFDAVAAFRDLSIYVMPLWLLAFPQVMPHRFLIMLAVGSIVIGGMLAFSGPPVYVSGTPRLASITGGISQMHPSAQFIALHFVLICEYYRARMLSRLIAWPTMLFALLILAGYRGRNEMVFVGAYFATLGYFRFRSISVVNWSPPILLVLFVIASVAALSFGHNVQDWGSGRIGVWQHRLGLIWNRDLLTFLFGGGLGADAIWNPQWWWWVDEPAHAHNGYLHIVMETGLIGLIGALIFLVGLYMRLPGSSKSIVIALVIATFFSNSYFQTPLLAFNFFILASVSLHCWHVRLTHWQDAPRTTGRAI